MISFEEFKLRSESLLAQMAAECLAAGRRPESVRLLPVTKTHPAGAVEWVAQFGLPAVGENRVQEAVEKRAMTRVSVRWELIGHLQSNKAKLAIQHFDRIQSVDSEKLLNVLNRAAAEIGKNQAVLLQINAGNDPAKFGADLEDAPRLLEAALASTNLAVDGLMTIAPLSDDREVAKKTFTRLRELRDELSARFHVPLAELSMGMSGDFASAIAAGSTQIRVGTHLFGARPTLPLT